MQKCLELLPHYSFPRFDKKVMKRAIQSMRSGLRLEKCVPHAKFHWHVPDGALMQHVHVWKI